MHVVVVCHVEFGYTSGGNLIFTKSSIGVEKGVYNLIRIAEKHGVKITFMVMPETVDVFPKNTVHEIGLHIHPGWVKVKRKHFEWFHGDSYLKEHCKTSVNSTALRDYPYKEQLELIKTGKEYIEEKLGIEPKVFVAGSWSENNDTVRALVAARFTHDCSPLPNEKSIHFDWSKLPRVCMPYHPSEEDYQCSGSLPLLMIPVSRYFPLGSITPEVVHVVGLQWLKAAFLEYYAFKIPILHIYLHSVSMTDPFYMSAMDGLLKFIAKHNVEFKYVSEISEASRVQPPFISLGVYLLGLNKTVLSTFTRRFKDILS